MARQRAAESSASAMVPDRIGAGAAAPAAGKKPAKSSKRSRPKATHVDERERSSREQETRNELFDRVDEDMPYIRPANLDAPPARPGMRQRWVHVGIGTRTDEKNLQRKLREGWRARPSNTVPRTFRMPKMSQGRFAGCVLVEGMLLCEKPLKLAKKRDAAIRAATAERTRAINENLLRVNEGAGGGFGPIRKGERSKVVREVPTDPTGGADEDGVTLDD